MSPESSPHDPIERLLAERAWLRRLAGALVNDAATAEDLTQDAYVVALQHTSSSVRSPRAWLATVLRNRMRNRVRDEAKRLQKETEAVRDDEVEPPDRAVARAELVERLGRLVLALPEPYRSTIVLRFFEDLPPRLVAKRQGVPVETVRTRTRRALKTLERQLDGLHDGRRGLWVSAFVPWVGGGGAAKIGVGGAWLMASKSKLAAGLLLVVLVGAGTWIASSWLRDPDRHPARPAGPVDLATGEAEEAHLAGRTAPGAGAPSVLARPSENALRIVGRVVDERRRPVPGVAVGAADERTRTDDDGRFELSCEVPSPDEFAGIAVRARAADGRVAAAMLRVPPEGEHLLDAGTLVLEAGHGLEVQVSRRGGGGVRARLLLLGLVPPGAGPLLETSTDGEGRAHLDGLPAGAWRILAVADGYGRGEARVWIPRFVDGPCQVVLAPPRDVRLRVLDMQTNEPVAGASVDLFEGPASFNTVPRLPCVVVAATDERGETVLEGLGTDESPHLLVQGAGIARIREDRGRWQYMLLRVPPGAERFECKVYRTQPVRWRILPGEVEPPPEGTVLRVVGLHAMEPFACRPARIEDGYVVADSAANGKFAIADDLARIAHLESTYGTDKEPTTSFRRPRSITVLAREADGSPVAGVGFRALQSNHNPLVPQAITDADGVARLEGLHGGGVDLWRAYPGGDWFDPRASEVDLEEGDVRIEVTLPLEIEVTLHVRVDGEPRLPRDYTLFVNRILVPEVDEDPEAATLRFAWRPTSGRRQVVHLETAASLLGAATLPEDAAEAELEIELATAGFLYARVLPPADGRYQAFLQTRAEAGGAWQDITNVYPVGSDGPPDEHVRFGPVTPGLYRVFDRESGVVGPPVEVLVEGPIPFATLDLRDVVDVRGRVEVPEGRSTEDARVAVVLAEPESPDASLGASIVRRVRVTGAGRFRARIPSSTGATLNVEHPVLRPDPERGSARVTNAGEEVVLALVATTEAVLRFDPPLDLDSRPRMLPSARLYRGEPRGEPARKLSVTVEDGVARIAGYAPGTWTLWVDMGVDLPVVFRDVGLGAGTTDLGTVSLARGSTLKVRILMPEGRVPPFLGLFTTRVEDPSYRRYLLFQRRETELELPGLLPGTWKLDFLIPEADRLPKEVTVGEDEVVDVVVDLR